MTSASFPRFLASSTAFCGISILGKRYIAPSAGWHDMPGRLLNLSAMYSERSRRLLSVRLVSFSKSA